MQASELLQDLIRRGCEVQADGDRLLVRPAEALDDALRAAIRQRKADLLALLAQPQPPAPATDDPALDPDVAWRVEAMRRQLASVPPHGPIPVLVARPEVPPRPELPVCLSCGDPLPPDRRYRCGPCATAAQIVLGWAREGVPWPPTGPGPAPIEWAREEQ